MLSFLQLVFLRFFSFNKTLAKWQFIARVEVPATVWREAAERWLFHDWFFFPLVWHWVKYILVLCSGTALLPFPGPLANPIRVRHLFFHVRLTIELLKVFSLKIRSFQLLLNYFWLILAFCWMCNSFRAMCSALQYLRNISLINWLNIQYYFSTVLYQFELFILLTSDFYHVNDRHVRLIFTGNDWQWRETKVNVLDFLGGENLPISTYILLSHCYFLYLNVYSLAELHPFHFPSTGRAQRSNSMAMWATRAPTAKRHLRTRCMTPTWSQPRPKLSDSIPHSTQCVRWYSPTSRPLPAQWIQPTSHSRSVTWANPAEGNKQIIQTCRHEQPVCVAYRSSTGNVGTATQFCSTFNLNDGTTSPRSPTERNKLEAESPGGNQEAAVVIGYKNANHHEDQRWDQNSCRAKLAVDVCDQDNTDPTIWFLLRVVTYAWILILIWFPVRCETIPIWSSLLSLSPKPANGFCPG